MNIVDLGHVLKHSFFLFDLKYGCCMYTFFENTSVYQDFKINLYAKENGILNTATFFIFIIMLKSFFTFRMQSLWNRAVCLKHMYAICDLFKMWSVMILFKRNLFEIIFRFCATFLKCIFWTGSFILMQCLQQLLSSWNTNSALAIHVNI